MATGDHGAEILKELRNLSGKQDETTSEIKTLIDKFEKAFVSQQNRVNSHSERIRNLEDQLNMNHALPVRIKEVEDWKDEFKDEWSEHKGKLKILGAIGWAAGFGIISNIIIWLRIYMTG